MPDYCLLVLGLGAGYLLLLDHSSFPFYDDESTSSLLPTNHQTHLARAKKKRPHLLSPPPTPLPFSSSSFPLSTNPPSLPLLTVHPSQLQHQAHFCAQA